MPGAQRRAYENAYPLSQPDPDYPDFLRISPAPTQKATQAKPFRRSPHTKTGSRQPADYRNFAGGRERARHIHRGFSSAKGCRGCRGLSKMEPAAKGTRSGRASAHDLAAQPAATADNLAARAQSITASAVLLTGTAQPGSLAPDQRCVSQAIDRPAQEPGPWWAGGAVRVE